MRYSTVEVDCDGQRPWATFQVVKQAPGAYDLVHGTHCCGYVDRSGDGQWVCTLTAAQGDTYQGRYQPHSERASAQIVVPTLRTGLARLAERQVLLWASKGLWGYPGAEASDATAWVR